MELLSDQEVDSLGSLEERIRQTIDLVARLRQEKEAVLAEKQAAMRDAADARQQIARMAQELESLRAERVQVRTRIEKLLGQIDSLAG